MRPCEITYAYFDNADQERILRDIVEPLRFLLPDWLRSLAFSKVDTEERYALKCNVRREYRMADISVRGAFFGQPKSTLRLMVIHEFIHLHHAYVNDFVRCRVQDFVLPKNEELNKAMQAEYTDHLEGFIQDFSYLIEDLIVRAEQAPECPASNTTWTPETPCADCGQPVGENSSHPEIKVPLCPVHRDLELIVPRKTCHVCDKPIDQGIDCVVGPPGAWSHTECFEP